MKLLNIAGRKTDNATVLPPDIVNAGQALYDRLAHRQHSAREVTCHHYVGPGGVRTNGHQPAILSGCFSIRARRLRMISLFWLAPL